MVFLVSDCSHQVGLLRHARWNITDEERLAEYYKEIFGDSLVFPKLTVETLIRSHRNQRESVRENIKRADKPVDDLRKEVMEQVRTEFQGRVQSVIDELREIIKE